MACLDEGEPGLVERKYAVLGDPISHSKSPAIHTAAYAALGLDWSYEAVQIPRGELSAFLNAGHGYSGFSLTMPLKEELMVWAASAGAALDEAARSTGVGNTLLIDGPEVFNTDVYGAKQALSEVVPSSIDRIALLGSGATAKSLLLASSSYFEGLQEVIVFARDVSKIDALGAMLSDAGHGSVNLQWLPLEAAADFGGAELTISTLPADVASQFEVDVPLRGGYLFDVTYNGTGSLQNSFDVSNQVSALSMLVWQALAQIRIFVSNDAQQPLTNEQELLEVMRASVQL